ncbi:MAG: lipid II flippase family protein [Candidatus Bruticola sp.]
MNISLLSDGRLLFIMALAAVVSMLTTLNTAARPAAIRTKQVALSLSVSSIFFMFTRFANLFYLPILGKYVDKAVQIGNVNILYEQIQWVVFSSALGALLSWLMLPTFSAIYEHGIAGINARGSMLRMLLALPSLRGLKALIGCMRSPIELKEWARPASKNETDKPLALPWDLLGWNIFATAIWTVGALAALQVSAIYPDLAATAVLLSGLVNSFAAIAFSLFVDPKAAVITDQAVDGQRPSGHVLQLTFHLGLGNFIGGLLGLFTFPLAIKIISWATERLGHAQMDENMWLVVGLNIVVTCLMCTSLSSRVSAVITKNVATSLAIYNVFFLITRLTTQVYAPILGSVRDSVVKGSASATELLPLFRWVIGGATLGTLLGWLLMPTFVAVYNTAIRALERRSGSMATLIKDLFQPTNWKKIWHCWRTPSNFGVLWSDLKCLPKGFLAANVFVVGVHVIGILAAIQAGAELTGHLARTATLLSSVINGAATILCSVIVDPTAAKITDEAVHGQRSLHEVEAMAMFLCWGSILGTVLSQILFTPSVQIIILGAKILEAVF